MKTKKMILKKIFEAQATPISGEQLQQLFESGFVLIDPNPDQKEGLALFRIERKPHLHDNLDASKDVGHVYRFPTNLRMVAQSKINLFTIAEGIENGILIAPDAIESLEFAAFLMAVEKLAHVQAKQAGNESGFGIRQFRNDLFSNLLGRDMFDFHIDVTLNDICRAGFGQLNYGQRDRMLNLLHTLDNSKAQFLYESKEVKLRLVTIEEEYTDLLTGAKTFHLKLCPIFGDFKGFGYIEQDTMQRLAAKTQRLTTAHYKLIWFLCTQERKEFDFDFGYIIKEMGLHKRWKKNRGEIERHALKVIEDVKAIQSPKLLKEYEIIKYDNRGSEQHPKRICFRKYE